MSQTLKYDYDKNKTLNSDTYISYRCLIILKDYGSYMIFKLAIKISQLYYQHSVHPYTQSIFIADKTRNNSRRIFKYKGSEVLQ